MAQKETERISLKTLLVIFTTMFRIGLTTFGGGLVMIPQMTRDFVDKHHWVDKDEILDIYAVAQSLPGVIAVNTSIILGYRLAKLRGALVATLGAVLPSLLILMLVAVGYDTFIENPAILGALRAIRATCVALLFNAAFSMRKAVWSDKWFSIVLTVTVLALSLFTDINVIFLILGGGILGLGYSLLRTMKRKAK
jgi:chromate transporter